MDPIPLSSAASVLAPPVAESPVLTSRRSGFTLTRWFHCFRDWQLSLVLLFWLLTSLGAFFYVKQCGLRVFLSDDWRLFTDIATGKDSALDFILRPQAEHWTPLMFVEMWVLGSLSGWDMRLPMFFHCGYLALAALALVLAARAVRGRSSLTDAVLPLLVLTPAQWHIYLISFGAGALVLALSCLCIAALATGWPYRSVFHLYAYFFLILLVSLVAGGIGYMLSGALAASVLTGVLGERSRPWRLHALMLGLAFLGMAAYLILRVPYRPESASLMSDSIGTTMISAAKLSIWWGGRLTERWWPWSLALLVIPGAVILGHSCRVLYLKSVTVPDSTPVRSAGLDLLVVLSGALGVGLGIAHGRALYAEFLCPRYVTPMIPVGVLLYLLLLRLRVHVAIVAAFTLSIFLSTIPSYREAMVEGRAWASVRGTAQRELRRGDKSLSVVAVRYCGELSWERPIHLLDCLLQLREARASIFADSSHVSLGIPSYQSVGWDADSGERDAGMRIEEAGQDKLLTTVDSGSVTYHVRVPKRGRYVFWCWAQIERNAPSLKVQVDDQAPHNIPLSPREHPYPHPLIEALDLEEGFHRLTLRMSGPGCRLKRLELLEHVD